MTTEGDGNHRLQRFLEAEGAEVDIQPLVTWVLYNIWEHQHDTRKRLMLRVDDAGTVGTRGQRRSDEGRAALGRRESRARRVRGVHPRNRPRGLPPPGHGSGRDHLAPVLRQPFARRRRPHGSRKADPDGRASEGAHGDQHQAVRLHAVIGRFRRRPVADHRALSGRHLHAPSRPPATARSTCRAGSRWICSRRASAPKPSISRRSIARGIAAGDLASRLGRKRRALHHPPHVVAGTAANQVLELAGIGEWESVSVG